MVSANERREPHIAIVGAGLAGISTAIQLKKQLGFENFTIYEKATAIGGTWRDNTYPGCGSDVPGHWYSLSTDLNSKWSSYYVNQPEIQAYWEALFYKYNLAPHTKLGHSVISAEWEVDAQFYRVTVEEVATGKKTQMEAEVLFYCIGGFMSPAFPKDITGVENFHGPSWHSARWRHDINLTGKRVGVIGNGCSAAQFVPEISVKPSVEVVNFCRTPQWYVPRGNYRYPKWLQWIFGHIPFVMRCYRNWIMARSDMSFLIFNKDNRLLGVLAKRLLSGYIKMKAPESQIASLTPQYAPGCKRIIVDPGYLEALHRPNVTVNWAAIKGIVEDGIELKSGEIVPLDVIIFGTGYSLEPADLRVRGSNKNTIHEYFAAQGGATAYLGTCMPGFPNCFTLLGPNVATGHASVIFSQESQIGLALQLIGPILDGKAKSFEVREDATNKYNTWLQRRLAKSVWTECNSYYQVGGERQTKIIATFPGPVSLFWKLTRRIRWEDFRGVDADAWDAQCRRSRLITRGFFIVLLVITGGLGFLLEGKVILDLVRRFLPSVVG